jgi:hypothetical protein
VTKHVVEWVFPWYSGEGTQWAVLLAFGEKIQRLPKRLNRRFTAGNVWDK